MLVYGDRVRRTTTADQAERLVAALAEVGCRPSGLENHARLTTAFITAGELFQGIADAEFEAAGCDDQSPAQGAAMTILVELGRALGRSWDSDFRATGAPHLAALADLPRQAPQGITCRLAEGYAYYAVYPEAYYQVAREMAWTPPLRILGLRNIGASLSAMVAASLDAEPPATVRPVGHPFERRLALSARLRQNLSPTPGLRYVVVDEGPGLSGSSFAAADEALGELGANPDQVIFLPSHGGQPGAACTQARRERWSRSRRHFLDFDALCLSPATPPARRLDTWVEGVVGPLEAPLRDISAGVWRAVKAVSAPAIPALERRKFIAVSERGEWLVKFAGLGASGEDRLARATALSAAGFIPPVAGLRHGFLVETWLGRAGTPDFARLDRSALLARLANYIGFRARAFPALAEEGADLAQLVRMAQVNLVEALGPVHAAGPLARLANAAARRPASRAVHIDGRMHAWEWLAPPDGRLLKADALDHSCQHDLIGCQDPAWDVVGAAIELGLSSAETEDLAARVGRQCNRRLDPDLLDAFFVCYPAFQIGLWSLPGAEGAQALRARYRRALLEPALPEEITP